MIPGKLQTYNLDGEHVRRPRAVTARACWTLLPGGRWKRSVEILLPKDLERLGATRERAIIFDAVALRQEIAPATCVDCACTEERACAGGCYWARPGVCSRCDASRPKRGKR